VIAAAALLVALAAPREGAAQALAARYREAVAKLNDAHAKKPAAKDEAELAAKLPADASKALATLLASKPEAGLAEALAACGESALDLDRLAEFEQVRARLVEVAPESAAELGIALSRSRFVARGLGGLEPAGLAAVADAFDEVLDSYSRVFGFAEWSKVPGKKLRLRVRLVPEITRPPHFAPQHPWHSEIDFPVIEKERFSSPTERGQFLLYGMAHELGHVAAMWGDRSNEEDHHAWAHYTGVVVVDELAQERAKAPALAACKDVRWRSLTKLREELTKSGGKPGGADGDQVLARLVGLHDALGPRAIGEALNALDTDGRHTRVNRVRYYRMDDLRAALLATKAGKKKAKEVGALFDG
jgi:hypothetical protein